MDTTKDLVLSSDPKPVTRRRQKSLRAQDICDILKACYDSNVARFEFEGLTVEFKGKDQPALATSQDQVVSSKETPQSLQHIETQDRIASLGSNVDEALDQLEIEDPYQAERFAISEDSTNDAERPTAPEEK